jgi:hypothetical protein
VPLGSGARNRGLDITSGSWAGTEKVGLVAGKSSYKETKQDSEKQSSIGPMATFHYQRSRVRRSLRIPCAYGMFQQHRVCVTVMDDDM